ncbi:MAG: hydrogenase [Acidimicrobiales bacterium]
MPAAPVPSVFDGASDAVAIGALLVAFGMLRAPMLSSQVRLYALQSFLVAALAAVIAYTSAEPVLYLLAAASVLLKVVGIPFGMRRILAEPDVSLAGSQAASVPTMVLVAIAVSVVGMFTTGTVPVHAAALPSAALGIAVAVVLVSFLLVIFRSDVVSQAFGFLSLENGVTAAGLVVAPGLPLIVEVVFLFDVLVVVVVLALLMRVHHMRSQTVSTSSLDRLKG